MWDQPLVDGKSVKFYIHQKP